MIYFKDDTWQCDGEIYNIVGGYRQAETGKIVNRYIGVNRWEKPNILGMGEHRTSHDRAYFSTYHEALMFLRALEATFDKEKLDAFNFHVNKVNSYNYQWSVGSHATFVQHDTELGICYTLGGN